MVVTRYTSCFDPPIWPWSIFLLLAGCRGTRPSTLAEESGALVMVKEARLPSSEAWYVRFATHGWFDIRPGPGETWLRVEVLTPTSGVRIRPIRAEAALSDTRWEDRPVRVRGILRGDQAAAAAKVLLEEARAYPDEHYRSIPGPNSNTFVAALTGKVPHLRTTAHHNAVGKDYLFPIGFATTPSKTGARVDTPWLGVALGLQEGIELHLAGLHLGVALWPPRLRLPFLPEIGPTAAARGL